MKRDLIARYERLTEHINEVIDIILNDCEVLLYVNNPEESEDVEISQLCKGISHIRGLCNGLKKYIKEVDK